jgi:predicted O-linked N-acetylglucosamine transferase (SPINDLY family)
MSPSDDVCARADGLCRQGRAGDADLLLAGLLARAPGHAPAWRRRGLLAYQAGRFCDAAAHFSHDAALRPQDAHAHSLLGSALCALGRAAEAEARQRRALALAPADPLVLNNLGVALAALGRHDEAAEAFARSLQASPGEADTLCNLAAARQAQGRGGEALTLSREALRRAPHLAEAHNNLGNLLRSAGQAHEAEDCYRRALLLAPRFALAALNLAALLVARGRLAEAEHAYRQALSAAPDNAGAHHRLGHVLLLRGRLHEALAAAREACRLAPADAEAANDLGNVLQALTEADAAEASYRRALTLRPGWAMPAHNLGVTLLNQGRIQESRAALDEARRLAPDDPVTQATYAGALHYHPDVTPAELLAEHRAWAERHAPAGLAGPEHANKPDPERRLRVGYVSPDLRRHAVAFFLAPILVHHDPAQVEVFCYAQVAAPDERTAQLRSLAHHWRDTVGVSDEDLAAQIRADGIDVLVDLAGHMAGGRLLAFARRPAPVQIGYLGYPGTTGLPAVGYRLTDPVADPPGEPPCHSEELVRLPGCFCCYEPPTGTPWDDAPPPKPSGPVTFGALHKLAKLNDAVLDAWCRILQDVPESRLLVARDVLRGPTADAWRQRFARRGLGPERVLLERVVAEGLGHLALYGRIDVALDAWPYGGHTSACEALWTGVPVVTLRGDRFAARTVASALTTVGLPDLIADDAAGYRRLAVELARDEQRRARLRQELRPRLLASPLCDGAAFTRGLEAAYRVLWRRWCDGRRRSSSS